MRVGVQFLGVFALLVAVGMLLNSLLVDIDGAAGSHDVAMQEYATLQCLGDRLLSALPVDATVAIPKSDLAGSNYWHQRLWELISPERTVTQDLTEADILVRLVASPSAPCADVEAVVVEK